VPLQPVRNGLREERRIGEEGVGFALFCRNGRHDYTHPADDPTISVSRSHLASKVDRAPANALAKIELALRHTSNQQMDLAVTLLPSRTARKTQILCQEIRGRLRFFRRPPPSTRDRIAETDSGVASADDVCLQHRVFYSGPFKATIEPCAPPCSPSSRHPHPIPLLRRLASYVGAMANLDLMTQTPAGLYCRPGNFFIDPVRPVACAVITHAHADHARAGHGTVIATNETVQLMAARLGDGFATTVKAVALRQPYDIGEARVTFYPAGHIWGSAQIAVEAPGIRLVASGDYKRAHDPTCISFEPVVCDVFITEATFGLPVFRHPDPRTEIDKLLGSRAIFPERPHLVGVYALGKAQRVTTLLRQAGYERPIYLHGAVLRMTQIYQRHGMDFGELRRVEPSVNFGGEIILCPPAALHDLWARRFVDPVRALASGWMRIRARARQAAIELPLVISDHADWSELCATVQDTACSELWVTHGQEDALVHWAKGLGLRACPLRMLGYGEKETVDLEDGDGIPA
jgi:putative mRNA 3-end processing factor